MRRSEFVLNEAHRFPVRGEARVLPEGAFVQPIRPEYVPKHILENARSFNSKTDEFVYCFYGIIVIPKNIIREIK